MNGERDKASEIPNEAPKANERWHYSLGEMGLLIAGGALLIWPVSLAARQVGAEHRLLFVVVFSQPILFGLAGLLRWQLRGGITGALIGAAITATTLAVLR
jgi:hypothetical protein